MFNLINLQKKEIYFGGISDEHFARKEKKIMSFRSKIIPFQIKFFKL